MRLASKGGNRFIDKQILRLFHLRKLVYQCLKYRPHTAKTVLFVVGCQRSGTTIVHHLLGRDLDSVTYGEASVLSSRDRGSLRLDPLDEVHRAIDADRAPLVVAKPLVESQNLDRLLVSFPNGHGLWMYRHYGAVASSNVKRFKPGTSTRDLAPILANDQSNWRAEHLAQADRELIRALFRPDMDPFDAAALFWYARNSLFFSRGFDREPRVALCRYDDLVSRPGHVMRAVYAFIGRPYPGDVTVQDVLPESKGDHIAFSPAVRELCEGMLARLDALPRLGGSS